MDVKFYFFSVEYVVDDNLFNYRDLKDFFENPLSLKTHLCQINEHKAFLEKREDNVFVFQKFRKDFNPIIKDEISGKTRHVELKDNEYFIEQNFLYWDFNNNVIIFQKSTYGFSTTAFENYIKDILKDKFKDDFFSLKPILSKNGYEKLLDSNIVKSFELSVTKPSVQMLKNLGLNSADIMKIDNEDLGKVEIKISSVKNRGLFNGKTFKDLIGNKNSYGKMRVKASDSYQRSGSIIDLLEDAFVVSKPIREKQRRVDDDDMIIAIKDVHEKNIKKALGG